MSRLHDAQCEVTPSQATCGCISRRQVADAFARRDAELRDRLDNLDDARTEAVLDTALRAAPDLIRKALRELSLIDPDAVTDALNENGVTP